MERTNNKKQENRDSLTLWISSVFYILGSRKQRYTIIHEFVVLPIQILHRLININWNYGVILSECLHALQRLSVLERTGGRKKFFSFREHYEIGIGICTNIVTLPPYKLCTSQGIMVRWLSCYLSVHGREPWVNDKVLALFHYKITFLSSTYQPKDTLPLTIEQGLDRLFTKSITYIERKNKNIPEHQQHLGFRLCQEHFSKAVPQNQWTLYN